MAKTVRTKVGNNMNVVEHFFTAEGNDYISVYVEDVNNNRRELVGTTFDGVTYTFNSKYVVFTSEEGVEVVFDIETFDFITDEIAQLKAYSKLLKTSMVQKTNSERDADYNLFVAKTNKRMLRNTKKSLE